jgi:hypothetical protein
MNLFHQIFYRTTRHKKVATKTIYFLIIGLHILSCDRLDGIDEGDRNSYTWKGRLVQDCNEAAAGMYASQLSDILRTI